MAINREILEKIPGLPIAELNLAHGLLLTDRYEEAKSIYDNLLDQSLEPGKSGKDLLREDLETLRHCGVDHPNLTRIEQEYGMATNQ